MKRARSSRGFSHRRTRSVASRDFEFLIEYAGRGEDQARTVCESLRLDQARFWDLALAVREMYPDSKMIDSVIRFQIVWGESGVRGPLSLRYQECADAARAQLERPDLSDVARAWLQDCVGSFERDAKEEDRREIDEDVNW